jgi:predicted Zn-ribbon and HTH transcriptional regulator
MKYEFYKKVRMIRCPGCGLEWEPRVTHPVKCPRCQFFFVKKTKSRVKEKKGIVKKAA